MNELDKIIRELTTLHDKAELHAKMIIQNGREVPDTERTHSAGAALAYSFCLMRLKDLQFSKSSERKKK